MSNQENTSRNSRGGSGDNHLSSSDSLLAAIAERTQKASGIHPAVLSSAGVVHRSRSPEKTLQKMQEFHGESSIYQVAPIQLPGENLEISSAAYDAASFTDAPRIDDNRLKQTELLRAAHAELSEFYSKEGKQSMLSRYEELSTQKELDALSDPLVGTTLVNEYKITGIVGRGAAATVYKAIQLSTGETVAIKTMRSRGMEEIWRFNLEIECMSKMSQKNLVSFIDCIKQDKGRIFLVMELVSGISLYDVLKIHGPIYDEETIWLILKQVCDALTHAHLRNVIHRDLKTGNVVLSKQVDGPLAVKVLDFGLAKHKGNQMKITMHGKTLGSPLYMSPEQCRGEEPTHQSDIYSLGILTYELLTGIVPFIGDSIPDLMQAHCDPNVKPIPLKEICPHIKGVEQLDRIVIKALETDASKRFKRVTRFKQALNFWIEGVRSGAYQHSEKLDVLIEDDPTMYQNINAKVQSITATMQLFPGRRKRKQRIRKLKRFLLKNKIFLSLISVATIILLVVAIAIFVFS